MIVGLPFSRLTRQTVCPRAAHFLLWLWARSLAQCPVLLVLAKAGSCASSRSPLRLGTLCPKPAFWPVRCLVPDLAVAFPDGLGAGEVACGLVIMGVGPMGLVPGDKMLVRPMGMVPGSSSWTRRARSLRRRCSGLSSPTT